jgi:hypothetical protein
MGTIYEDKLVEITDRDITFRHYFFPFGGEKRVSFDKIEHVEVSERTFLDGSWRIWGSGDFRTWFPLDKVRPTRDRIFVMFLRGRVRRIGFTVEHSEQVIAILKRRGLLHEQTA